MCVHWDLVNQGRAREQAFAWAERADPESIVLAWAECLRIRDKVAYDGELESVQTNGEFGCVLFELAD